jgi:transcriptional regulator with XRE-family HTH domain
MLDYKKIGERVKEIRRLKNMTQAKLAELTGMSDTYISHIR